MGMILNAIGLAGFGGGWPISIQYVACKLWRTPDIECFSRQAIGSITNAFSNTNNWSTNIQSVVVPVNVYSVYQAIDGTNSVVVFIP